MATMLRIPIPLRFRALPGALLLTLLQVAGAAGEPAALPSEPAPAAVDEPAAATTDAPIGALADRLHSVASEHVLALSRRLDSFFFDPTTEEQSNETRLRMRLGLRYGEGGEWDFLQRVYLRLDLPETQRRLHLFLYETDRDTNQDRTGELFSERRDEVRLSLNTGLRYVVSGDPDETLQFLIGTRLYPQFDPFVELRGRTTIPVGRLAIHPAQYLYWRDEIGLGETTILDTDFPLSQSTRLRLRGEGTFSETSPGYAYLVSLSYAQQIRMQRGFIVGVEMLAHTRPEADVEHYLASFTWRQLIHDRWLYFEPAVQVRFPEREGYSPEPALLLIFEATFGNWPTTDTSSLQQRTR